MLHGIDISAHQSSFDADGQDFVFIKATEGRSYASPHRADQAAKARDAGCVVGFYHFLWPGNIAAQAEYFIEKCGAKAGELLAVDWETTSAGTHASSAQKDQFLREVKKLRPHHRVLLYTNVSFWKATTRRRTPGTGSGSPTTSRPGSRASRGNGWFISTPTARWTRTSRGSRTGMR